MGTSVAEDACWHALHFPSELMPLRIMYTAPGRFDGGRFGRTRMNGSRACTRPRSVPAGRGLLVDRCWFSAAFVTRLLVVSSTRYW